MNTSIVTAQVTITARGVPVGTLRLRWNDADYHASAWVQGQVNGATVKARRIAP